MKPDSLCKIAVVGLDIGHAEKFSRLLRACDVSTACVWDRDVGKAEEFARQSGAKVIKDLRDTPWSELSGAIITTTTKLHSEVAIPFLERGIPLFIDKQLAVNWRDALAIRDAAERGRTRFLSGSIRRYAPGYRSIAVKLKSMELGRPLTVYMYEPHGVSPGGWQDCIEQSGGFIVNYGIHCVDPLVSMLGSDLEEINCQAARLTHDNALSEDVCILSLSYQNGTMATLEILGAQRPVQATQPMMRVHFAQGTLEAWLDEGSVRKYRGAPVYDPESYEWSSGCQGTIREMTRLFTGVGDSVNIDEQLASLRILLLARRSYEEARRVRWDETI